MRQPQTRQLTLHRLIPDVHGTLESMFDAFADDEDIRELDEPAILDIAGSPALFFGIQNDSRISNWCADASITTGLPLAYTDSHSGGLLVLGVDDTAYALSYGCGFRLIPDRLKDQRFGLSFQIRSLDAGQVSDIVRRRPDTKGRTDSTLVSAGAHVWTLGTAGSAEIIRRIGGKARNLDVTFSGQANRRVKIVGAAGITMRFGVDPEDLIADIRECARVCREEQPDPALEFVEYVHPVTDATITGVLDSELDDLLSGTSTDCLVPVVPTFLLDDYHGAHTLTISIGGSRTIPVSTLTVDDILRCVRSLRPGRRVEALRKGCVSLNADDAGTERLGSASAIKWFEACLSIGSERYFLMDGDWFQIGADYVRTARNTIGRLFPVEPSVELPPWSLLKNRTEREYNEFVASQSLGRFLCLDRSQKVRHPLGPSTSSLEICDLLGPGNELIHVKRAKGSAPLSHLFQQGLQGAQCLLHGPSEVRERFVQAVASLPNGRTLPADFRPTKLIYAILMEKGQDLTPDTLFPFSQAALAHAANILGPNIEIEVIGIPAA